MEKDAGSSLTYYLSVRLEHKESLARIRHWSNLKAGFETDLIWVKDFDDAQIRTTEVRAIPFKKVYYEKGNRLFQLDHNLPERIVPSLLWSPVDRVLPVTLPALNHNFFGTKEHIDVTFISRDVEIDSIAMIAGIQDLGAYLTEAPAVRIDQIRWTLLDGNRAFLLGTPHLPIPGQTYWSRKDQLIPTGFDFELSILADLIQKKVNPGRDNWVVWNSGHASHFLIPKADVIPLSRSSFKLTLNK